jgi:tetratricopeptide (TPR) repeat protein
MPMAVMEVAITHTTVFEKSSVLCATSPLSVLMMNDDLTYLRDVLFSCFSGTIIESAQQSRELLALAIATPEARERLVATLRAVLLDPATTFEEKAETFIGESHRFADPFFRHIWELVTPDPWPFPTEDEPPHFSNLRERLIDLVRSEPPAVAFVSDAVVHQARLAFLQEFREEMARYRQEGKVFFVRAIELPYEVGFGEVMVDQGEGPQPMRVRGLQEAIFVYSLIDLEWYEVAAYPLLQEPYDPKDPRLAAVDDDPGIHLDEEDEGDPFEEKDLLEHAEELLTELEADDELIPPSPNLQWESLQVLDELEEVAEYELMRDIALAATEQWPSDPDLAYALYRARMALGGEEYAGAKEAIERAISLSPDTARFHHGLGELLLVNGEPEEALRHFDRSLECDPENRETMARRAVALVTSGRAEEARGLAFRIAAEIDRGEIVSDEAADGAGMALLLAGETTDAERLLRWTVQRTPESEYFRGHLEWALRESAQREGTDVYTAPYLRQGELRKRYFE